MHDLGLILGAIGFICLSLEGFGVAVTFFVIGAWCLA
jgi:hypothetical protein